VLFRLDPVPFELALAKAEAEVLAARTRVETMRAAYREARTELAEAETRSAFLARQAERQRRLEARGAGAGVKRDEAEHEAAAAIDRANTLRQKIQRELAALGGDPNRPTDEHPLVREAVAMRDRAAYDRDRTVVTAPADGVAVNVKLQAGEHVRAATALFGLVAALRPPWVEANLKETELTHIRIGQPATVAVDAYPGMSWRARVASISPASGAEFAVLPPQNASGNWVKVVQRLPVRLEIEGRPGAQPLRAGMTVTVRIDTGRERSLSGLISAVAASFQGEAEPTEPGS